MLKWIKYAKGTAHLPAFRSDLVSNRVNPVLFGEPAEYPHVEKEKDVPGLVMVDRKSRTIWRCTGIGRPNEQGPYILTWLDYTLKTSEPLFRYKQIKPFIYEGIAIEHGMIIDWAQHWTMGTRPASPQKNTVHFEPNGEVWIYGEVYDWIEIQRYTQHEKVSVLDDKQFSIRQVRAIAKYISKSSLEMATHEKGIKGVSANWRQFADIVQFELRYTTDEEHYLIRKEDYPGDWDEVDDRRHTIFPHALAGAWTHNMYAKNYILYSTDVRDRLASQPIQIAKDSYIVTPKKPDRWTNLNRLAEQHRISGNEIPTIRLPKTDGTYHEISSLLELDDLLKKHTVQVNKWHNAHQNFMKKVDELVDIEEKIMSDYVEKKKTIPEDRLIETYLAKPDYVLNPPGTPVPRPTELDPLLTAWKKAINDIAVLSYKMQYIMDADAKRQDRTIYVPPDLEKARLYYRGRIETAAVARRQHVVNAQGPKGALLDASCPQQSVAISEISAIKQRAFNQLSGTTSIGEMRRISRKALSDLRSLEVSDTPVWKQGDKPQSDRIVVGWKKVNKNNVLSLNLSVENPNVDEDLGPISIETKIEGWPVDSIFPFAVSKRPDAKDTVDVTWTGDDLAFGHIILTLSAYNACGPSDIEIVFENPKVLIKDTQFSSLNKEDSKWETIGKTFETIDMPSPETGKALKLSNNDNRWEPLLLSRRIPLDHRKRYDLKASAWQTQGDRINSLIVEFFDEDGTSINSRYYPDSADRPVGWDGFGTYAYWGCRDAPFPKDSTTYTFAFGGDAEAAPPLEADSFRIGAVLCYSGSTESVVYLRDYEVTET